MVDNIQEETLKKSSDRNNVTMKKLCVAQGPMFRKAEEAKVIKKLKGNQVKDLVDNIHAVT